MKVAVSGVAATSVDVLTLIALVEALGVHVTPAAFLAATAATLFVFKGRGGGHPYTTAFFILVALGVVISTFVEHPVRSLLGWALVAAGLPIYAFWRRRTT